MQCESDKILLLNWALSSFQTPMKMWLIGFRGVKVELTRLKEAGTSISLCHITLDNSSHSQYRRSITQCGQPMPGSTMTKSSYDRLLAFRIAWPLRNWPARFVANVWNWSKKHRVRLLCNWKMDLKRICVKSEKDLSHVVWNLHCG